ncbi:hypothetical protein YPPY34_4865, partial [Yersinia pestis PY-34]
MLPSLLAKHH